MMACPVIKVILGGQRDAHKLATFRDCRLKASGEQIARSLEGNWQEDLLFVLKQEQDGYEFRQKQMAECDRQRAQDFQQRKDRSQDATLPEEQRKGRLKKKRTNKPQSRAFHVFDIAGQSVLTAIPRTIGLAAAKCVEIDYSIGISQGQKIRK
jgi:hypothetical protein